MKDKDLAVRFRAKAERLREEMLEFIAEVYDTSEDRESAGYIPVNDEVLFEDLYCGVNGLERYMKIVSDRLRNRDDA